MVAFFVFVSRCSECGGREGDVPEHEKRDPMSCFSCSDAPPRRVEMEMRHDREGNIPPRHVGMATTQQGRGIPSLSC